MTPTWHCARCGKDLGAQATHVGIMIGASPTGALCDACGPRAIPREPTWWERFVRWLRFLRWLTKRRPK